MRTGRDGHFVEAELLVEKPINDLELQRIALSMGLEDVFSEDFADFPDVNSYLYDERVRRRLDELGHDSCRGEAGYIYVTVVCNPVLIRVAA